MSAVVAMNEEARRIEQFNDIVENVKPLMTTGKEKNQRVITGSAVVPLSLCFVDSRYQGMRAHKHLNRLRNKWDERKLTPIILVWHPEEHRFAIVDGQGRYIVAGEKGIDRLNAIILMDAPDHVSTHSTRKTFGYWSVKLHPYDVTTVDKLQGIFSHSDRNTTLHYIGIAREDEIKLYNDMGDFVTDISNGKKPVVKNSPVVPLKAEDFREILSKCWDMAQNGEDKFNGINNLIGLAEKCMV